MNSQLQDEILTSIAKEMQREIDDDIMSTFLVDTGWTSVKYYYKSNKEAVDIAVWLKDNCQNQWRRLGSDFVFENTKDAEWFILRWS